MDGWAKAGQPLRRLLLNAVACYSDAWTVFWASGWPAILQATFQQKQQALLWRRGRLPIHAMPCHAMLCHVWRRQKSLIWGEAGGGLKCRLGGIFLRAKEAWHALIVWCAMPQDGKQEADSWGQGDK